MASKMKTTLKHLKDVHGVVTESSHLFGKIAEVAKAEGINEVSEYARNEEKEMKKKASEIESLIHKI